MSSVPRRDWQARQTTREVESATRLAYVSSSWIEKLALQSIFVSAAVVVLLYFYTYLCQLLLSFHCMLMSQWSVKQESIHSCLKSSLARVGHAFVKPSAIYTRSFSFHRVVLFSGLRANAFLREEEQRSRHHSRQQATSTDKATQQKSPTTITQNSKQ